MIIQNPTFDAVNETGTLVVTCKANAMRPDPTPTSFKWQKDRVELSTNSKIDISETTDASGDLIGTLMIMAVTSSDNGNYKCSAVSSAGGTPSSAVAVRIQGKHSSI